MTLAPTSSALSVPTGSGLSLQVNTIDDLARLARVFAASGLFGRSGDPDVKIAECAIRLMAGMEAGFTPFASATGVHIIEGKPAFSSNLLAQAIRRHPVYDYRVLEKTAEICRIEFTAHGKPVGVEQFTIEDGKRAGLATKPNWQKFPAAMLFSRCLSAGMRTYAPDALGGAVAYTPEELGGDDATDVTTVTAVVSEPAADPVLPPWEEAAAKCEEIGLTPAGVKAFCLEQSGGAYTELSDLPSKLLNRLSRVGMNAETVARLNAPAAPVEEPEESDSPATDEAPLDDDDIPLTWAK
jgi:hypothetical protein